MINRIGTVIIIILKSETYEASQLNLNTISVVVRVLFLITDASRKRRKTSAF